MMTTIGQMARFGIVGTVSNILGYLLYLVVTAASMEHKLAMTLLYIVGVAQTFIFNKRWSFDHNGSHSHTFIRYFVSYGAGYLLNFTALYVCVDRLGFPHQVVQGVMVIIVAAFLFMLQKFWVFRTSKSGEQIREFNHE